MIIKKKIFTHLVKKCLQSCKLSIHCQTFDDRWQEKVNTCTSSLISTILASLFDVYTHTHTPPLCVSVFSCLTDLNKLKKWLPSTPDLTSVELRLLQLNKPGQAFRPTKWQHN